ncbi:DMT family transporter [Anaerocolumna sp. AGMB13025]|uniref:DMT family transporter n=1 Tax=Anaerocolumna sp. AGMB13025 TaxID=3039116 RepID=UPI00241EE4FF|nr:DMT family transporter [Anaerocolumna sp. AGMB13025]WFR59296.1 DMT family transporter [Anaerocolumna sp. AGMB13025]
MNYLISLIIGAVTSIMILLNGTLSDGYGNYASSILIHISGLIAVLLILFITRTKFRLKKGTPIYLYCAGFIGVATVLFTNLSFEHLGVSLTLALGLLGQTLLSLFLDHFGLMGFKASRFNPKKLIGLLFIGVGILVMTIY